MKRLRTTALCLVATFALSAIAAQAASAAEPAVYECAVAKTETVTYRKKPTKPPITKTVNTGNYKNSTCSKPYTKDKVRIKGEQPGHEAGPEGPYQLQEFSKASSPFAGTGGGANLEVIGVGGISCTHNSDSGEFTGPKTVGKIKVTFTGCEFESKKCQGDAPAAAHEGEILTNNLVGEVGYVNKGEKKVGGLFKPETGLYFTEFNCGELKFRVSGGVIGNVTSTINAFTNSVTLDFKESAGIQNPLRFEGGLEETLMTEEGGKGEWPEGGTAKNQSGQSLETTNTGETLELKA